MSLEDICIAHTSNPWPIPIKLIELCLQGFPRRLAQTLVMMFIPIAQDPKIAKHTSNARPACIPIGIPSPARTPVK